MFQTNKQMIFSVIIFTTILFGIYSYFVIYYKMWFMDAEYPMWQYTKETIHKKSDTDYNFIAIGDSRIKSAFIPKEFDDENFNTLNLALGGSSAIEGYYTLKTYMENNPKPEHLLISYSPGMLMWHPFYWYRTVNFQYLENDSFETIEFLMEDIDNFKTIPKADFRDVQNYTGKYFIQLIHGVRERRWNRNFNIFENLKQSKGHVYFGKSEGSSDISYESQAENFVPSPLLDHYVDKLIKFAVDNDIKVYWYALPFNESSFAKVSDEYVAAFDDYVKKYEQKYGLTILKSLHSMPDQYFGDMYHVYSGGPIVTQEIKSNFLNTLKKEHQWPQH